MRSRALMAFMTVMTMYAQIGGGSLVGNVTDQSGAAVSSVKGEGDQYRHQRRGTNHHQRERLPIRMMFSTDSAVRISRTVLSMTHLFSFTLRVAFPLSGTGRYSRDYYENSVTIGLAPLRRSRASLTAHVVA